MIFREWYGVYYRAVAAILTAACEKPVTAQEVRGIAAQEAFGESPMHIEAALLGGQWPLLCEGKSILRHPPALPMSGLEKRWLKAISLDPRIRLFDCDFSGLSDVEPLFTPEDIHFFDRYTDGDPFDDPDYVDRFRLILRAIRGQTPLRLRVTRRSGGIAVFEILPRYLEYSEKDDKFRLISDGSAINLSRIVSCESADTITECPRCRRTPGQETLVLEVTDRRNAPERVMLHFAHFEKEAERLDARHFRVSIRYSTDDETELLIRVLSFGPFVRAVAPEHFVAQIRNRLRRQLRSSEKTQNLPEK